MAYTSFKNGFKVGSASAIDQRILLSKAEMKTAEDDYMLPDQYFAICSDDGKLYLFNINNEPNEETGKYREVTADLSEVAFTGSYNDLKNKLIAGNCITITVDSEGNNVVSSNGIWGTIDGNIENQADLKAALDLKANDADLKAVAKSGSYNDLINKPTIPAAQVPANWVETDQTKASFILNKPTIGNGELTITRNEVEVGKFKANNTENVTIDIHVSDKISELENDSNFVTQEELETGLNNKVDKIVGYGLSANNLTNELKSKIEASATISSLNNLTSRVDANETAISNANTEIENLTETKQNVINETNKLDYSLLTNTPNIPSIDGKANQVDLENEINARETEDSNLEGLINQESGARANAVSGLQTNIDNINNKLNTKVITDITFDLSGDTSTINYTKADINLLTTDKGSTTKSVIGLADNNKAGLMSPSDVNAIVALQNKVSALEGKSTRLWYKTEEDLVIDSEGNKTFYVEYVDEEQGVYSVIYTLNSGTTLETLEITAGENSKQAGHIFTPSGTDSEGRLIVTIFEVQEGYDDLNYHFNMTTNHIHRDADAENINAFAEDNGFVAPFTGLAIVVEHTYHIWRYYPNMENGQVIGWKDDGLDTVTQFTNTNPGIILGSETNGKVYAETDGTGSVNGWSELSTQVSQNKDNIETNTENIGLFRESLTTKQNKLPEGSSINQTLRWDGSEYKPGDSGVLSIINGSNAIRVTNGESTQPSIDLSITSAQGNVTLTKANDGLKADIADSALTISKVNGLGGRLDNKVDKESGKSLTTNDFTNALKSKLDNIAPYANNYTHPSYTENSPAAKKVGNDSTGHVVLGDQLTGADIGASVDSNLTSVTIDGKTMTKYSHPVGEAPNTSKGLYKFSTDAQSHINSVNEVTAEDITNIIDYKAGSGLTSENNSGKLTFKVTYNDNCYLSLDGWSFVGDSEGNGYWSQTVNGLTGVTSNSNPILDVLINPEDYADVDKIKEAWGEIFSAIAGDGSITFYAKEEPEIVLRVQIKSY